MKSPTFYKHKFDKSLIKMYYSITNMADIIINVYSRQKNILVYLFYKFPKYLGLLYRTIYAPMLLSMLFFMRNLCLKVIKQNFLHVY